MDSSAPSTGKRQEARRAQVKAVANIAMVFLCRPSGGNLSARAMLRVAEDWAVERVLSYMNTGDNKTPRDKIPNDLLLLCPDLFVVVW